jgi:ParB-like chromosome segregation protein Spo0J
MNEVEEVIQLDRLLVTADLQPRSDGLDPDHIKALVDVAGEWPPLVAVRTGGNTVVVDGFHRFAAAQNLGLAEVRVRVLDPPADGDLAGLAFLLNAVHGRALTLTDRRREAERLLRKSPQSSDREIGRHCGLSQPTVRKVRTNLESSAQIERTETRVGRGGYQYSAPSQTEEDPEDLRLAKYLVRLATVLEQSNDLGAWTSPKAAAKVVQAHFEEEQIERLVTFLGPNAQDVLQLVSALGYEV